MAKERSSLVSQDIAGRVVVGSINLLHEFIMNRARKEKIKNECELSKEEAEDLDYAIEKQSEILLKNKIIKQSLREEVNISPDTLLGSYASIVIFAQYECGTGVVIDRKGIILTCAHCLGDRPHKGIRKLLVSTSGDIFLSLAVYVDVIRDTSLLQVVGIRGISDVGFKQVGHLTFPFAQFADDHVSDFLYSRKKQLATLVPLFCIGQPGRDDLESKRSRKTKYPIIASSRGRYLGKLEGDLNDNSDIGKLVHDCWTYWGHSGAPLFNYEGKIVGIHSSWDDESCTRHGVHLQALKDFVSTYSVACVEESDVQIIEAPPKKIKLVDLTVNDDEDA